MEWGDILALVICIIVHFAIGAIFGLLFGPPGGRETDDWYNALRKPSWLPTLQKWQVSLLWSILYPLMAVSSWLVLWKDGGFGRHPAVLVLYIVQLVLHALWTPIFFRMHPVGLGLVDMTVCWICILATIVVFSHVSHVAAYLLIPYVLWITLATVVVLYLWIYNSSSPAHEPLIN